MVLKSAIRRSCKVVKDVEVATLENFDRVSFGLFEMDIHTGELWKAGFRVRLPGQPFKVLTVLVA